MKLLTPQANKDLQAEELTRKIFRTQETEEAANKANMRLAKAEADFAAALARNKETWAEEERQHAERVKEMSREVEELESRKAKALIPIQVYEDKAVSNLKEANDLLEQVKQKDKRADQLVEKLEERLDDVSEREKSVSDREVGLDSRERGISLQAKEIEAQSKSLSETMRDFYLKAAAKDAEQKETAKNLQILQVNLEAREERLSRNLEAIRKLDLKLKDERATLDRAWKELEAKKMPK